MTDETNKFCRVLSCFRGYSADFLQNDLVERDLPNTVRGALFLAHVLAVAGTDEVERIRFHRSSADKIQLGSAVGAVQQSAVFVDLAHRVASALPLSHLPDNVPCHLIDNGFMCVFKSVLLTLRSVNDALVFIGYDRCATIDGMPEVDFVIKNPRNRAVVPAVHVFRIGHGSVYAFGHKPIHGWLWDFLFPQGVCNDPRPFSLCA